MRHRRRPGLRVSYKDGELEEQAHDSIGDKQRTKSGPIERREDCISGI